MPTQNIETTMYTQGRLTRINYMHYAYTKTDVPLEPAIS